MPADTANYEALLQEWHALGAGDRKAILRRLPIEQRLEFQHMIAREKSQDTSNTDHGQRYRGYTAWLAGLLATCENETEDGRRIKPPVRAALMTAHELASGANGQNGSLEARQTFAQTFLHQLRSLL